jgi:cysteine desulfurase/selenocysteine lyase
LESQLAEDDEVIVTTLDHHSNIVPWHIICQKKKANLVWVECTSDGALSVEAITRAITNKTRLISVTQMSNVVGYIVDVQAIVEKAHAHGVAVVIDGTQAAVHMPVNVEEIGCDFYAITGHKLYGPSGCGALFIHPRRFSEMQPMQGGGNMIRNVSKDCITYNDLPHLLEAGTPPIAQIIGWKKAFDYLDDLGFVAVQEREEALGNLMEEGLSSFPWLKLHGVSGKRHTIFSFSMDQVHPHDIATVLDKKGIAVRAGHHCAQPLMKVMDVQSTCRASLAFYNTEDEINFFIEALEFCYQFFNRS